MLDEASQTCIPPITTTTTGVHDNGFNEYGAYALNHRKILRKV